MTPRQWHNTGVATALSNANLKCPQCGYALAGLPTRTCPECGRSFDPGVLAWRSRHERRRRWLIALVVMAFVLYAPFSWIVLIDYPWSNYHWLWFRMWPVLPGLPATILLRSAGMRLSDSIELVCMGVFTALALLLLTWFGARGRRWLVITAIVALGLSCFNGWIGYVLFQL